MNPFVTAAIFAIILSLFGGCTADIVPSPSETNTDACSVALTDVLTDKISSEGVYSDDIGNIYNYSYHMPELLIESDDAGKINRSIEDFMMSDINQELEGMEDGVSLMMPQCGYGAYLNGNVLSLVLFMHTDFEYSEYVCFNIDVSTGKELSNAELLTLKGWDSEKFLSAQKNTLERAFFILHSDLDKDAADSEVYLNTVSEDNLSVECPMYFGPDYELRFIGKIYSFGGADYYNYPLSAESSTNPFVEETQTVLE